MTGCRNLTLTPTVIDITLKIEPFTIKINILPFILIFVKTDQTQLGSYTAELNPAWATRSPWSISFNNHVLDLFLLEF